MKTQREIKIEFPVVLLKEKLNDQDCFVVACDLLGVYAQGTSEDVATEGFQKSITSLLKSLEARNHLIDFFKERDLVKSDVEKVVLPPDLPKFKIPFGSRTNVNIPAYA